MLIFYSSQAAAQKRLFNGSSRSFLFSRPLRRARADRQWSGDRGELRLQGHSGVPVRLRLPPHRLLRAHLPARSQLVRTAAHLRP